jgi:hypothetical protein
MRYSQTVTVPNGREYLFEDPSGFGLLQKASSFGLHISVKRHPRHILKNQMVVFLRVNGFDQLDDVGVVQFFEDVDFTQHVVPFHRVQDLEAVVGLDGDLFAAAHHPRQADSRIGALANNSFDGIVWQTFSNQIIL